MRNASIGVTLSVLAVLGMIVPVHAQSWPVRPVRLVVPFPPGGINDVIARVIGPRLADTWGQPVVIDNRPGAGSVIGTDLVARSTADGHTLLLVSAAHAINVSVRKLPYDSVRDFAPITYIGSSPFVLVVHPSLAATTVPEFVALARASPGRIAFGSSGSGTSIHLMGEMLRAGAKIDVVHVPYKGIAPALVDLISGQVQFSFGSHLTLAPHIAAKRLRPLAVTSPQRSRAAPELPTIAESGVPGYRAVAWYGIMAPAATPREVVQRLNAGFVGALAQPDVAKGLTGRGVELVASTPAGLAEHLESEIALWGAAVRASGAKAD